MSSLILLWIILEGIPFPQNHFGGFDITSPPPPLPPPCVTLLTCLQHLFTIVGRQLVMTSNDIFTKQLRHECHMKITNFHIMTSVCWLRSLWCQSFWLLGTSDGRFPKHLTLKSIEWGTPFLKCIWIFFLAYATQKWLKYVLIGQNTDGDMLETLIVLILMW